MERRILSIGGEDRLDFLQGLVTNDLRRDGLIHAALLTPQGKYIADFFLLKRADDILLDVAEAQADDLVRRLTMYKLRAKVTLAPTELSVSRGTGPAPQGAVADPRHPGLGWRLYGPEQGGDGTDWTAIRVAHCIPEYPGELDAETYILEAGFERLNGVDFRKGCYVGQEVTARMKHKTELRKGFATVTVIGSAEPGTEITSDGKPVGRLCSRSGTQAIAYLRFDRATGPMQAENAPVTLTT